MGALVLAAAGCGGGDEEAGSAADAAAVKDRQVRSFASAPAPAGAVAGVRIAVDNGYTLYVNGTQVGSGTDWTTSNAFGATLNPGDVVAVDAVDLGFKAGVIAEVTAGGMVYGTDAGWKVSTSAPSGWNTKGFNDANWAAATDYGPVNAQPWGSVRAVAGIPTTSIARWIWTSTNPTSGTPTPRAYFRFVVPSQTPAPAGFKRWSDPATWGGTVPPKAATVVVPAGTNILLDQDVDLSTLTVNGTLQCDARDLKLTARWVMVAGKLQCGTATSPYLNQLTVTLTGAPTDEDASGMGSKFLGAGNGGTVDLYGKPRTLTWTQLANTAAVGATQITLRAAPGWTVGDQIVIASTARDMNQAEVRTITAINGAVLTLNAALAHRHQGPAENYGNANRTWVLDQGAEVGLLTHNIVIQGDDSSANSKFGGHTMFMAGSKVHFSHVRLYRMGQTGRLGRYPFHWHLAGDVSGQSIVGSSIVESYHRAVTIHGTNSALVKDNVAYNILGHAYFLEDGSERFNVIDHNLGVVNVRPAAAQAVLETDSRPDFRGKNGGPFEFYSTASGPATFWISHAENTVINNAAAGSEGTGFWFHTDPRPTGPSANVALAPLTDPQNQGRFNNNRAHSSYLGFGTCSASGGFQGYQGRANFTNFTTFHVDHGFWPCNNDIVDDTNSKGQVFSGFVIADVVISGLFSANPMYFTDSAFIGRSTANPTPAIGYRGPNLYDAGYGLSKIHFANYADNDGGAFGMVWGNRSRTMTRISGMTRQNVTKLFYTADMGPIAGVDRNLMGDMVHDLDGSLTGRAGTTMVTAHPMVNDGQTQPLAASVDAYVSPYRYARLEMTQGGSFDFPGDLGRYHTVTRSDGAKAPSNVPCPRCVLPINSLHPNTPVIVNGPYSYSHTFDNGVVPPNFVLQLNWAKAGDTVVATVPGANATSTTVSTAGWTRMTSAAAVTASEGRTWFVGSDGLLVLKLRAAGSDWFANDTVSVFGLGTPTAPLVACASDGGTCTIPAGGIATVQFGANGANAFKTGVRGAIACSTSVFGDPAIGVGKSCSYRITGVTPSPVCANESGSCTVPAGATATVYYGANGQYAAVQGVSGAVACNTTTFKGDPAPNVVKSCTAIVTGLPSGVVACANDLGNCTVPSGRTVTAFYGQNGVNSFRTGLSGSFACAPSTFGGDPLPGVLKSCRF